MVIALVFGSVSVTYKVGLFVRPGPGMFPLIVSSLLFMIGLFMVVRARFVAAVAMDYKSDRDRLINGPVEDAALRFSTADRAAVGSGAARA